ncbi:hypothetical protein ASPBRDRAFT_223717 [Aspergillus brasiliensis CBS 101740]|uniref:Uncharacterized protein n=1 Tax=Aspergillus brasiliensis (strain CBS 101740 / IMI 381727 / IBT 21946) TaxID=767769 RepID=A0A1L9UZN9_ASPBC|nr:hypothetical protein ASPBRDRAFT_223717 [Aspergillus brasiliensis CBS 101740]
MASPRYNLSWLLVLPQIHAPSNPNQRASPPFGTRKLYRIWHRLVYNQPSIFTNGARICIIRPQLQEVVQAMC